MRTIRNYINFCLVYLILSCIILPLHTKAETESVLAPDSVRLIIAEKISIQKELFKRRTPADVDSGITLMTAALELAEKTFGQNDTMVAHCLTQLGFCYFWSDSRSTMVPLVKRAIETWKRSGGEDHPYVGRCWRMLGDYHLSLGNHSEAEAAYQEGIRVFERIAPIETKALHQFSYLLTNLAQVKMTTGDYVRAESLLVRGKDLRIRAVGEDSPSVIKINGMFAKLYRNKGQYAKAEQFYQKAIDNQKELNGINDYRYAGALSAFAFNQFLQDKYEEAGVLNDTALNIITRTLGKYHSKAPPVYALQAKIEEQHGNLPRAIKMARLAYEGRLRASYRYSPNVFHDQTRLARLLTIADSTDKALEIYADIQRRKTEYLSIVFRYTSEKQKISYNNLATPIESSLLSLALNRNEPNVIELAFEMILNGKSVVIDAIAAERENAYCSENKTFTTLLENYSDVCTRISNIFVGNKTKSENISSHETVDKLFLEKDQMERELSRLCALYAIESDTKQVTIDDIVNKLPDSLILIEYIRFRPFDFTQFSSKKNRHGPPTYLAFSLTKADGLRITDIGLSKPIDVHVLELQSLMEAAPLEYYSGRERPSFETIQNKSSTLYNEIIAPILTKHSSCTQLVIAPDGLLNLVSFNILSDTNGTFLLEKMAISMVTSGRDILQWYSTPEQTANQIATLFFSPDYDNYDDHDRPHQLANFSSTTNSIPLRGTLNEIDCLGDDYAPLPQSVVEGEAVESLLVSHGYQNIDAYDKIRANETNLKQLSYSPTILHIASHGFYCEPEQETRKTFNPLLFSGLVLAGANRSFDSDESDIIRTDDGILTALELSSLNLSETKLVVMSACQSGMGEVRTGQGVFGLRRAILLAGADAALMSMFKVPDMAAQKMMTDFYSNWLGGMSRANALREASLTRIRYERNRGRSGHPLFWGGFILVGNPD